MRELIDKLPEDLHPYAPAYDTVFVDLNRMSDKQLKGLNNMLLVSALMMQKYSYDSQLVLIKFVEIINETEDKEFIEGNLFGDLIVTVFEVLQVDKESFNRVIKELPPGKKTRVMTLYQSLIQEGIEKGIEKGAWQNKIEVIVNGRKNGATIDFLAKITELDIKQVKDILAQYKDDFN